MTETATPPAQPSPLRPRVVVIDDSTVIRGGFAAVHPDLDVVAAFASVEEFEAAATVACDVVILDLLLRGPQPSDTVTKQGRSAIRAIRALGHRLCLYSDERRPLVLALCLRAGADGVIHKSDPPQATSQAVRDIIRGEVVITQSLIGLTELLDRRSGLDLSPRQREVISGRARGRSWNHIASSLFIAEDTARDHYRAACAKLKCFLQAASPGDLERAAGIAPGDILDLE